MRIRTFILFLLLVVPASAHGAGRVFYDGFEDGTTNAWSQDDFRNKCTVVTSAADGVIGPYDGTKMARCADNGSVAWNDPAAFENLVISSVTHTNEIFYRLHFRADQNVTKTSSSPKKITRIYVPGTYYNESYYALYAGGGCVNQMIIGGTGFATYWGGSDDCANPSSWHTLESYFNSASGNVKLWIDSTLVRNDTSSFHGTQWYPFYLVSNWSDAHDATNYFYFDKVEIFSDTGSGASGLMSDASISASGGGGGTPPAAPFNLQAN